MWFSRFFNRNYIFVLALLPLLSLAMVSIAIGIFAFGSLFFYFRNDRLKLVNNKRHFFKSLFWYSLPFPLFIICLLWTNDLNNGVSTLEEGLSFIIIPIILFLFKPIKTKFQVGIFIRVYIISSGIFSVIMITYVLYNFIGSKFANEYSSYMGTVQLRSQFDKIPLLNEHPIYFTLLTGTALLLLFYNKFKKKWLNVFLAFILLSGVLLASSRGPILALFFVFMVISYLNIKNKAKALALISFFIVSGLLLIFLTPLKSRIDEILNTKNLYPVGVHHNSFNLRMGIYKCSLELMKNAPLYGFGSGDVQIELDHCYKDSYNTIEYQNKSYNTHNQYFHYWLSFGALGLILILFSYLIFIQNAICFKDQQYGMFLLFFFIAFLTENILNRNTGIVLFTVFNNLLFYRNFLPNDSD